VAPRTGLLGPLTRAAGPRGRGCSAPRTGLPGRADTAALPRGRGCRAVRTRLPGRADTAARPRRRGCLARLRGLLCRADAAAGALTLAAVESPQSRTAAAAMPHKTVYLYALTGFLAFALGSTATAAGPRQPAPSATGAISGIVTDGSTGLPLQGALVQVASATGVRAAAPQIPRQRTDARCSAPKTGLLGRADTAANAHSALLGPADGAALPRGRGCEFLE
jgi:hypothetical protein